MWAALSGSQVQRSVVSRMTEHIVHITRDDAFLSRLAEYREPDDQDREDAWQEHIECTVPDGCGGWQECQEPHEVDGVSADDAPLQSVEDRILMACLRSVYMSLPATENESEVEDDEGENDE